VSAQRVDGEEGCGGSVLQASAAVERALQQGEHTTHNTNPLAYSVMIRQ
jgi:hypothetical protein